MAGGGGFLGSHLVDKLLNLGHEVIVVDNFSTGNRTNLSHLSENENLTVIEANVIEPLKLKVSGIFNLASPASPQHYQFDPVETIKTNLVGSINLLELAKLNGCRILQASTSEIYGDPTISPQVETYWGNVNPIGIRACYDEGKRAAETVFFDYQRQYGVNIAVARIFNTYGPRMAKHDGRVVSNFIVQALTNSPLTLYGNGEQTRSFCFVSDLIQGLVDYFNQEEGFSGPMNIGNPSEMTMNQLAKTIINLTASKSIIEFQALPQDDPVHRKPDVRLAKEKINWQPKVEIEQGLAATIQYFKANYKL